MRISALCLTVLLIGSSLLAAIDKRLDDTSGLFAVEVEGNWGFINVGGQVVIPPRFEQVRFFSEGLAAVQINGKWGFIDISGKLVIPAEFGFADWFSEGLASVTQDENYGFIDKTGCWAINAQFQTANPFSEGLALVRTQGVWRYIDKTGAPANSGEFEDAFDFSEGLAAVQVLGKWGFINREGRFIIEPSLEDAYLFHEGWAPISIEGEANFINKQGELMTDSSLLMETEIFSEGLAVAQSLVNGKYGYVDRTGNFVVPARYDIVFLFHEGLAAVSKSGRYGFIDKSGKEVIPLIYDFTEVFIGGLARVKRGEQWIYIDRRGNTVWPQQESESLALQEASIEILYDMAGLTQVAIQQSRLKYFDSEYRGKDPKAAGNPEDYVRKGYDRDIQSGEIEDLLSLIRNSGFLNLEDVCGNPDPTDRHYPVRISIKAPGIEKSVLYRSHPDYPAPSAFKRVEEALLRLARGKQ